MAEDTVDNPALAGQETVLAKYLEVARLRATDPRDYIPVSALQKRARQIDANPAHPWEILPEHSTYFADTAGEIVQATIFLEGRTAMGYLFAYKSTITEEPPICVYLEQSAELSREACEIYQAVFQDVGSRFPLACRQDCFQQLSHMADSLVGQDQVQVANILATTVLSILPDRQEKIANPRQDFVQTVQGQQPEAGQLEQLNTLLGLVQNKISQVDFDNKLAQLMKDLPSTTEVFGHNFPYLLLDVMKWTWDSREDTNQEDQKTITNLVIPFPITTLISHELPDDQAIHDLLSATPVTREPNYSSLRITAAGVEFMDLANVVGASSLTIWTDIQRSDEDRTVGRIVGGLVSGASSVTNGTNPILVNEYQGKYWVGRDGTHRVAALKVLGVSFAPMVVTHYV